MRAYYWSLERATSNITALALCVGACPGGSSEGRLADPRIPLFPLRHLQERLAHPSLNDAPDLDEIAISMHDASGALDEARARTQDPLIQRRLREEARRFAYGQAMLGFWQGMIRVAAFQRAGNPDAARRSWPAVEAEAARLREVHDLVQVAGGHIDVADGLAASGVAATYEAFKRRYGSTAR